MSARARSSTAGPSSLAHMPLPPYEPPEHPINASGQEALAKILQAPHHRSLEQHLRQAAQALADNGGAINERLADRKSRDQKIRRRNADTLDEVDEQRAQHVEDLQDRVNNMTKRMEEILRKTIDGQHMIGVLHDEVNEAKRQAINNASASQRMTQTQRRHHDDDDENMTEYDPTLPGETQRGVHEVEIIVPSEVFQDRVDSAKRRYQSLSLPVRYAEHADYGGFKKAVHDASYVGDERAPPLPPARAWFTSSGAPAPGVTTGGEDSDDDIAIAAERISTKCPLTLREFTDPYTSRKCPHTFERTAIMELVRQSNVFLGSSNRRRDGPRAVQCPVAGCSQMLAESDLHPDAALIRKIKRIQRQREDMDDDSDGDRVDDSRIVQTINSDALDGYEDVDGPSSSHVVPKMERLSGMTRSGVGSSRGSGMGYDGTMDSIQSSNVVDLGSDSEE